MAFSVNTNLLSLSARQALGATESALATTVRRLSSGLRVNGARDDAAGLAIAERLTSRLRGQQQALRNTHDGLSMFQTADGALGQMSERLQRARELLVQSLGGSSGSADRQSLDAEVQQSLTEVDRLAASTAFNGHALLDGSYGVATFQIGAAAADTLDVNFDSSLRAADIGAVATAVSSDLRTTSSGSGGYAFAATTTTVPITNLNFSLPETAFSGGATRTNGTPASDYSGGGAASFTVDNVTVNLGADYGSLAGVAAVVQGQLDAAQSGDYGVSQDGAHLTITKTSRASNATVPPTTGVVSGANAAAFAASAGIAGTAAQHSTNAGFTVDGHRVALVADHSGDFSALLADIQGQLDSTARGAYRVAGSAAGLSITRSTGVAPPVLGGYTGTGASVFAAAPRTGLTLRAGDLTVQVGGRPPVAVTGNFLTADALAAGVEAQVGGISASINNVTGALEIDATQTLTLAGAAAQPGGSLAFTALSVPPTGSLDDVDANERGVARRSVMRIDAALDSINAQRSSFGALEGRFEAVATGLQSDAQQTAASRGRIVDADYASETANLAREQVLQQAALAMVAQANAHASDVLALVR